ncbi:hypothetical protein FRC07_009511 [Ceratobasidium sp. 392]|nr:hypothetical protein FRC07_009511 [Ceratobasidium sp. 392]
MEYQAKVAEWHQINPGKWPLAHRPYPLSPGTFEQTADLCLKCSKANHTVLQCPAKGNKQLEEHERKYRTQPNTPTTATQYCEAQQVEYSEGKTDLKSKVGSLGKE